VGYLPSGDLAELAADRPRQGGASADQPPVIPSCVPEPAAAVHELSQHGETLP